MAIIDWFPLGTPRQAQIDALQFIEDAVFAGYKDIVIEAPTGVGKSAIGACVAFWSKNEVDTGKDAKSYYLVTQKMLQRQLENDVNIYTDWCSGGASVSAALNYACPEHENCGLSARKKGVCSVKRSGGCPYVAAKQKFLESPLGITNYNFFFSAKQYTQDILERSVIVLDECHNLEGQIVKYNEGSVDSKTIEKYALSLELPTFEDGGAYVNWLEKEYAPALSEVIMALVDVSEDDQEKSKLLFDADQHVCKINRTIGLYRKNVGQWIYWEEEAEDPDNRSKKMRTCFFRALKASPFYKDMIGSIAPIRIHLSAYPGEKSVYCNSLGLKQEEVAWISLPSTFDPKKRQILSYAVGSMASKDKAETLPVIIKMVEKILSKKKDRGIIHCGSYDIGRAIYKALKFSEHGDRLLFPEKAADRDEAVETHAKTEGAVIISPSMIEGFDFKDDLARWQIIAKVPYMYLGDAQIACRAKQEPEWYKMRAVMNIIQAAGRVCRNENDYGTTYILDSDFKKLYYSQSGMFPQWFKDAVIFK